MDNPESYCLSPDLINLIRQKEELDLKLQSLECRLERLEMECMKKWATDNLDLSVDSTSHIKISPFKVKTPSHCRAYSISSVSSPTFQQLDCVHTPLRGPYESRFLNKQHRSPLSKTQSRVGSRSTSRSDSQQTKLTP